MKHTEVGDIPADWEVQTFEETFRVLTNNTLSRADLNDSEGTIRNIHYGDILTRYSDVLDCDNEDIPFLNSSSLLTTTAMPLQDGDVILADTAEDESVGKATEIYRLGEKKMVAGLHTIPCRVKKGNFAPRWLGYFMNSHVYHDQVLPYITGIKVSSISKSAIAETMILIPPVLEQEKIVAVLSEIDALIANLEKLIEKHKAIKQGCLECMFPRNGQTVPERRLPGFTGDWEQRKIGDFTSVLSASRVHKGEWEMDGVPFYRSSDVVSTFKGNDNEKAFISIELYEELIKSSGKLEKGDILITGGGSIGIPYIVPNNDPLYSKDADLIWVKKSSEHDSEYLYTYFTSQSFREYISSISHVGTIAHYTIEQVKDTPVQLPAMAEQKAIGVFFSNLDNLITLNQRKTEKYKMIKQGIMSELLTGKIRLV